MLPTVGPSWKADFKETDLTHVKVGQRATAVLDMYPDITWQAEVESISPATGAEFAILPPQNACGQLRQGCPAASRAAAVNRATSRAAAARGMTAYVSIDTGRTRNLASIFGTNSAVAARP